MKKSTSSTFQVPALRRLVAGVMLCCAASALTITAPALAQEPTGSGAALNFVNADMESVIKAVGHYTGMTFIIDPRVKGTLTLVSEKTLSKSQAFALLTSALRLQGYAVVTGDGFAKVVPEAEAKLQASPTQVGVGGARARGDQIATQIFRLSYESAANLTAVLRPLISPNNSIMANPGNNSLVITDYADNLRRLSKIIAALDAPVGGDLDVVPVRYAVASDVAIMVSRLMEPAAGGDSGRVSVLADPRTNSVVVRAPSAARANLARSLIAKLDQPTAEAGNVHVVYLKNADATKLAQTLRAVVSSDTSAPATQQGTQGGSVPSGTQGTGGGAGGQQQQQSGGSLGGGGGSSLNAQSPGQTTGGGSGAAGAGFIQADVATNTLIITASEAVYRNLRAVIDQLDVRRAQVYIEALIVEVGANKASEFGVQWLTASGDKTSAYRVGAVQNFNATSGNALAALAAGGALPGPGISVGIFRQINGALGLGAIAHALQNDQNTNVLSTPNMLTLDNELSTIKVGQNVPIISGQFTTAAGGANANPFQTIDRRDVGITLKVRPQISEGGTIKLAIYTESSSVVAGSRTDPAGVTTNIRIIENNVISDDGQIIVLGGLITDDAGGGEEKVPGLGDIPFIGNLFKYRSRTRNKSNLMVFLRPVIVRSKEDSNAIAMDRYNYMRSSGVDAQPQRSGVLLNELGTPVLPALTNGQPPVGGAMAGVPPKPAVTPAQARTRPGTAVPLTTTTPIITPAPEQAPLYRPVQK
ncbi:type II secretion system secretin GspD [Massilia psychrophila]|uniref:Type II secretion system protein GspD n=1 Tax=Massilia psychrophila TaxID=1603353 RepID=A0A2G8SYM8_9BURK|nr:type II secretion system secretin GspD [Massilia psychrophila]PIL38578.1 type II secretion system protein GspD [Massilia psychrophila]GGE86416.1 type II secretion system protein GspD [Massilia psychrophila]